MKKYKFICHGHDNILAEHRNTLEFTKDSELTEKGDCIIGINADYDEKLLSFIHAAGSIKATLAVDELKEEFRFIVNRDFTDMHELVIRITDFISPRTLGIRCNKAAKDINREIVKRMKNPSAKMHVIFEENEASEQ